MGSQESGEVQYLFIHSPITRQISQIVELYRAQGWWQRRDDEKADLVPRLIAGSHCFAIAADGEDLVGMGRAISDGVSDAYIQDLTVRQDRRNQGIGSRLLQTLLVRLHSDGILWIGLIAEPGSDIFYRKAGFREISGSTPFLMIKDP